MIDSMPFHGQSWVEFARRHDIQIDVADLLRRTTGRTGPECMNELFGRLIAPAESAALVHEKETIYRELFTRHFKEVKGFKAFSEMARLRGLKVGVGTAGDRSNIEFALTNLKMKAQPMAVVGGDQGLPGKPDPAIFLEVAKQLGVAPGACIVFEDAPFGIEAARRAGMRAVAILTSHSALDLAGPNVIASATHFAELIESNFLESLHVATA